MLSERCLLFNLIDISILKNYKNTLSPKNVCRCLTVKHCRLTTIPQTPGWLPPSLGFGQIITGRGQQTTQLQMNSKNCEVVFWNLNKTDVYIAPEIY